MVGSNPSRAIKMVETLEEIGEIDGHGIDMSEFNEDYPSPVNIPSPLSMPRGHFDKTYDP